AALAKLQNIIIKELAQPFPLQEIRGERAILDEIIRRIRDAEIPISALSESRSPDQPVQSATPVAPGAKLIFDHQRAVGLEWMNELVAIAREPTFKRPVRWSAWEAEVSRVRTSRLGLYLVTLPLLIMPAADAQLQYQAELSSMAILLAA